jgi:DNA-directed RNA polymerase subunit H (RpoH/RPB5)
VTAFKFAKKVESTKTVMDADTLDLIVRSRPTILEILENRGYDVGGYKGVSPDEIFKLAATSPTLLKIIAEAKADGGAPMKRAIVLYWVDGAYRHKVEAELRNYKEEGPDDFNPENDELVVLHAEVSHDSYHTEALHQWTRTKTRVGFFCLRNVISNPARHIFVPPHRKLSADESTALLAGLHLDSRSKLAHIKYHVDMQARVHGLVPGDIVEITRPSETCGTYVRYRVCVP